MIAPFKWSIEGLALRQGGPQEEVTLDIQTRIQTSFNREGLPFTQVLSGSSTQQMKQNSMLSNAPLWSHTEPKEVLSQNESSLSLEVSTSVPSVTSLMPLKSYI